MSQMLAGETSRIYTGKSRQVSHVGGLIIIGLALGICLGWRRIRGEVIEGLEPRIQRPRWEWTNYVI